MSGDDDSVEWQVEYPAVEGTLAACLEKVTAKRDALANHVAALREALAATKSAMYCGEGVPGITEAALADTEAAAKEHDQRLRLEGGRLFAGFLHDRSDSLGRKYLITELEDWLVERGQ